jgi:UDP-N-acetylmuramyl tripeptide synthase
VAVEYFGASPTLHNVFVNDDTLHQSPTEMPRPSAKLQKASVELVSFNENAVSFRIGDKQYDTTMQLTGVYNFLNAAGALAVCKAILGPEVSDERLITALASVQPAFGRGETLDVGGNPVELILVKNPAGFRLALASFDPADTSVMIAINDNYADGRDMSWLWDVDFTSLQANGVDTVSGIRAFDMALRLNYDNVPSGHIEPDLKAALQFFLSAPGSPGKRRIFCTYSAMLKLRRLLKKYTKLEIMA